LIRFDRERQEKTAQLLLRMSKTHQIIYFTCHSSIQSLFEKVSLTQNTQNTSFFTIDHFSIQNNERGNSNENSVAHLFSS